VSHLERNRALWTRLAVDYAEHAAAAWAKEDIVWGIWDVPESQLGLLGDVAGKDVIELGCGTAYFSAWLAKRGARVVGVDLTPAQLDTARELQERFGLEFPLIEANAEEVPLPDASFDLVLSEYGASIWADPYRWVPEAARLLQPGGELVFLRNSTVAVLTWDEEGHEGDVLRRDYFGLHRIEWADDGSVEFQPAYGEWISILRSNGFEVLDLVEVQAPETASPHRHGSPTVEWARRWPSEEIWRARKRAD
jgi:SAM-dependent methyltransferase